MNKRLLCSLCLLCAILLGTVSCSKKVEQQNGNDGVTEDVGRAEYDFDIHTYPDDAVGDLELTQGVYISEVFAYTGAYIEDGSNDPCEGVCAVRLFNSSDIHYQYLSFSLQTADGSYTFNASTVFAGATVTVLCEDRSAFTTDRIIASRILSSVPFAELPSVHLESLKISYTDGFITVKNLTDQTLNDLYVYFKNSDDSGFIGGITYRAAFGELPAGGILQKNANNIRKDGSTVVFVTYVP